MLLSKETHTILDTLASMGYVVEIVDTDGVYIYCSDNGNFANINPKEMLGKNMKDIYGLSDETSKVMQVIRTGVPLRDYLMNFRSSATGETYLWLYSAYPLVVAGKLMGCISAYRPFSYISGLVHEYDGSKKRKPEAASSGQSKNLFTFSDIIYACASMAKAVEMSKNVAKSGNASVLLVGETGTGKELFAQSIHTGSDKCEKPFVAINCAAIPDTLLESTLFGVTKGAYTGAIEQKGLFEHASEGTLFLDEIQALSPEMQAKLLRVLEYKVVRRVGSNEEVRVNPRIITAMNVNPYDYMNAGKLKPDLFYRIALVTINVPPLRERLDDLPLLVNFFIRKNNQNMGRHHVENYSDEVMACFCAHNWPGNVRELQHAIEHAAIVMDENSVCIQLDDLPDSLRNAAESPAAPEAGDTCREEILRNACVQSNMDYKLAHKYALDEYNKQFHKFFLKHALEEANNNVSRAAQNINITRQHLHKLIKQFDI